MHAVLYLHGQNEAGIKFATRTKNIQMRYILSFHLLLLLFLFLLLLQLSSFYIAIFVRLT